MYDGSLPYSLWYSFLVYSTMGLMPTTRGACGYFSSSSGCSFRIAIACANCCLLTDLMVLIYSCFSLMSVNWSSSFNTSSILYCCFICFILCINGVGRLLFGFICFWWYRESKTL